MSKLVRILRFRSDVRLFPPVVDTNFFNKSYPCERNNYKEESKDGRRDFGQHSGEDCNMNDRNARRNVAEILELLQHAGPLLFLLGMSLWVAYREKGSWLLIVGSGLCVVVVLVLLLNRFRGGK